MDLVRILSFELNSQAPADTTVVSWGCSNEVDVLCFDPILDIAVLRSNHKEADTKFVLRAVSLSGHVDIIVVSNRGTDVLLL